VKIRRDEDGFLLEVSEVELMAFNNALNETLEAVADWEFHPRTGVERHEMKSILDDLRSGREQAEREWQLNR
jgi:hypothetical protein